MTLRLTALLLMITIGISAQSPTPDDQIYQAIREGDLARLRSAIHANGVRTTDAIGQTPLMMAAAFGSPEAVKVLLDAGADATAASASGTTALHFAATSAAKTQMLLEAGADVHATSATGRTPLLVAASANGTADVIRLLLGRGATVDAADSAGVTPLIAAANVDDPDVVRVLLSHGANVSAWASAEGIATPLIGAARNGNLDLVRLLLARKPDVNAATVNRGPTVKNGQIQFGSVTALHLAVVSGNVDVVKALLDAGARVDPQDIRGMTPLMLAVATDRAQPRIVRLLLDRGASPTVQSTIRESAIDWARKFNAPAVLSELKLAPASQPAAPGGGPIASHAPTARAAVERSLPLLRTASGRMLTDGGCVACHAQPLTGLTLSIARTRGWTDVPPTAEVGLSISTLTGSAPDLMLLRDGGGRPDGLLYMALLLATEHVPATRATDALVHYVAAKQRKAGYWSGIGGTRAPMQDGNFSRTAMAIRTLKTYATPARATEYTDRVTRAARWLARQTPITTEDRVMQLLGLHWAATEPSLRQQRTNELLTAQRLDGGWGQTPQLPSDAYATGQALYTLRELGVPASDSRMRRAADYLQRTQHGDGSWHVVNRAMKIQPYFDSGFPHEHDQWISHAGTAWAAIGLTATAEEHAGSTAAR